MCVCVCVRAGVRACGRVGRRRDKRFVVASIFNFFCDKRRVLSQQTRDETFVAIKMILVAAPANDILRIFQLSNTILYPCQSVLCVCACV